MAASAEEIAALTTSLNNPPFTVKVDGYEWHVSSKVIARRSTFFNKVCHNGFKEANERSVTLHDESPWMVARMIKWLYIAWMASIDFKGLNDTKPTLLEMMAQGKGFQNYEEVKTADKALKEWEIAVQLYHIADKYIIPHLMQGASRALLEAIENDDDDNLWKVVVDAIGLQAFQLDQEFLKSILRSVYRNTREVAKTRSEVLATFEGQRDIIEMADKVLFQEYDHRFDKRVKF